MKNNENNINMNKKTYISKFESDAWKKKSKNYLMSLEDFLDKCQSIKDEDLRREIIIQMLKCDNELSNLAESIFEEKYNLGFEDGKKSKN